jgi:Ca2+/H+ antiporter
LTEIFLETAAPPAANVVVALEIGMGLALLVGAWLARKRRFRQHAWCQSTVVLLNLAVIVVMMIPSFRVHVLPRIHAALGIVTELAGLYILLSAGTSVLPEKLRITKYKAWMRTVLVLWWVVLLLGFATYARWYVPHFFLR